MYAKSSRAIVGRKKNSQNKWLKRTRWGSGRIECGVTAALSAGAPRPVMLTRGTHGLLPSSQSSRFRWVLCCQRCSVQKELAQCLLPGGIRNRDPNPCGAFEQVSLESHRRLDRLSLAKGSGYGFIAWTRGNAVDRWPEEGRVRFSPTDISFPSSRNLISVPSWGFIPFEACWGKVGTWKSCSYIGNCHLASSVPWHGKRLIFHIKCSSTRTQSCLEITQAHFWGLARLMAVPWNHRMLESKS